MQIQAKLIFYSKLNEDLRCSFTFQKMASLTFRSILSKNCCDLLFQPDGSKN